VHIAVVLPAAGVAALARSAVSIFIGVLE